MDDDKFRKELLSRLDKILALLSLSCGVSEVSLEEPKGAGQTDTASASGKLSMKDEMLENYNVAIRSWEAAKSS